MSTLILLLGQSVQDSAAGKDVYTRFRDTHGRSSSPSPLYACAMIYLIDNRRDRRETHRAHRRLTRLRDADQSADEPARHAVVPAASGGFRRRQLHQYVRFRDRVPVASGLLRNVAMLSAVMLVMLVGNVIQMAIWATLFMIIGEFEQFAKALYFSSVTFATLGYGDVVLSEQWRLLSGVEAANGILMFGVSTAVMTAAVLDVMKRFETGVST